MSVQSTFQSIRHRVHEGQRVAFRNVCDVRVVRAKRVDLEVFGDVHLVYERGVWTASIEPVELFAADAALGCKTILVPAVQGDNKRDRREVEPEPQASVVLVADAVDPEAIYECGYLR